MVVENIIFLSASLEDYRCVWTTIDVFYEPKGQVLCLDWIKNHQDNSNDKLLLIFELQGWLRGTKLEEQPVSLLFLFIYFF